MPDSFTTNDPAASSDFRQNPIYQQLYKQILGNTGAGGFKWDPTNTAGKLDQYGNDFTQQFQNAVGRPPTADEINQFYSQAVNPVMTSQAGFYGTDPNQVVQQFIPQAFGKQIQQNQQSQLPNLEKQISDLSANVGKQTASQLADPTSGAYQKFSGAMNNLGITPSSGAFQAGEGAAVGGAASDTMQQLLSSLGGGAIGGNQSPSFQNLFGMGQQAGQGMDQRNKELLDFNMQSDLARELSGGGGMSTFQQAMAGLNTGANVGQGVASFKKPTWICTAMWRKQVLGASEVDRLHHHLFKSFFRRFFKFMGYFLIGRFVVGMAESKQVDWESWRPLFYDRVIAEPDSLKALELYEDAFWRLLKWAYSTVLTQQETIS